MEEVYLNKRVKIIWGDHVNKHGVVKQVFSSTGRLLVQLDEVKRPVTVTALQVVRTGE